MPLAPTLAPLRRGAVCSYLGGYVAVLPPRVGDVVELDSGRSEKLLPCADWNAAQFRFPNPIYEWRVSHAIACNVEIVGRALRKRHGDVWVRVKITWVGDEEPDVESRGWLLMPDQLRWLGPEVIQ